MGGGVLCEGVEVVGGGVLCVGGGGCGWWCAV